MRFYYTGAKEFFNVQSNIDKSIGGWISNSPVPNDVEGNLFSDISYYGVNLGSIETKAVALKNEHPDGDLTDLYFWYEFTNGVTLADYEIAFVSIPDQQSMEKIANFRSTPLYVSDFINPLGEANKVLITNSFLQNTYLGVWIRRKVDSSVFKDKTCEELNTFMESIEKFATIEFHFDFT